MKTLREIAQGRLPEEILVKIEEYEAQFNADNQLVRTLSEDASRAISDLQIKPEDQYLRRTLVRTLFAMIEGDIFILKQTVLAAHRGGLCELSPQDYSLLTEKTYDVNDKGKIRDSQKFIPFLPNLRFTFSIYVLKLAGLDYQIDTSTSEWEAVIKSVKIRNRLMHPKSLAELFVSDEEMKSILSTAKWFSYHFQQVLRLAGKARLDSALKTLKDHLSSGADNVP